MSTFSENTPLKINNQSVDVTLNYSILVFHDNIGMRKEERYEICESSAAHLGYGRVVPIPAGGRVQYQLIHRDSYQFGYDTGTGPSQSFREETRDSGGTVRGRYGYIDPLGTLRIVDYMADHTGFHILSSVQLTAETAPTTPRPTLKTTRRPRDPIQLPFLGAIPPFLPRQK
ncbi:hypothetical protein AVEN_96489-1 [Araneus ventricosus]|uniref:Cuticle protein 6 n=1 Tax=Araneus ventricosus TaxID=182803 RepID=A0A4Y2CTV7_ARAVE|nr:hypothetical protein AVEN_96489-1 [Araneus ventricosus]